MNVNTKQKGFTIIEVVLVLAIAALIFLMVFIALPALQRGQRDTGRKQDVNAVASAVNTWRGNHRGSLPDATDINATDSEFKSEYVKTLGQYDVNDISADDEYSAPETTSTMLIVLGSVCPEDGGGSQGDESSRGAAIYVKLEASDAIICTDA